MSCPLPPLRFLCSALLGLAVLGGGACAGTPLPEPPDSVRLPRPELFPAEDSAVFPASTGGAKPAVFTVSLSGVPTDALLTVLNLDAPATRVSAPAVADASLGLVAGVRATPGDRLRVLFTSDRGHSPPLDLVAGEPASADAMTLPVMPLGDTSLRCLQVTPNESLVLSGTRGRLAIANTCEVSVQLTRVALFSGAEGINLVAPATTQIAAGARTELILTDALGAGPSERLDVLLLDVRAADGGTGRYAIDVFSALQ
jgi:hypothetical protein